MRYWFDTEFHDDGYHIALISIGILAEDGREYYAISSDYDKSRATPWLRENVLPLLGDGPAKTRSTIQSELASFFSTGGVPEFWSECGEYDWIVLRQLFGSLTDWPQTWPYLSMDIEQWRLQIAAPAFPAQAHGLHNALDDARMVRQRWYWLDNLAQQC